MDVAEDMWFDPLFLVIKGMQDKQMQVLECIKMISAIWVMNSTGGLSNNSNGMPKAIRPIMDSALVAMAMMQGLTSAIVNPNDLRLMETIKSCDVIQGQHPVCRFLSGDLIQILLERSRFAICVHEQVAKRIANVRFTAYVFYAFGAAGYKRRNVGG